MDRSTVTLLKLPTDGEDILLVRNVEGGRLKSYTLQTKENSGKDVSMNFTPPTILALLEFVGVDIKYWSNVGKEGL